MYRKNRLKSCQRKPIFKIKNRIFRSLVFHTHDFHMGMIIQKFQRKRLICEKKLKKVYLGTS